MEGEIIGEVVAGLIDVAEIAVEDKNRNNGCLIFVIVLVAIIIIGLVIYYFTQK